MSMKPLPILGAVFLIPSLVNAQYFDARNNAMGGVGTASSHYLTAGWANPALLTRTTDSDNFGVLIPTFGLTLADEDGLVEAADDFSDELDAVKTRLDANTATVQDLTNLATSLLAMDGKTAQLNGGAGFAVGIPIGGLSVGTGPRVGAQWPP